MKPLHIETPLFESRPLTIGAGQTVWLKLEAMQPPGSFKIRGIGSACQEYARRGAERFISSSGGNAGIAVAYAGRHLSIPVVVVVPDRAAVSACQRFITDHRLVVEPACGASLAAIYDGAAELEEYKSVLVVVCGGVTVSAEQLREWSDNLV